MPELDSSKWFKYGKFGFFLAINVMLCTCTTKQYSSESMLDYIHQTPAGRPFKEADDDKYKLHYAHSIELFKKILQNENLTIEQRCYGYNQLVFIFLQLNENKKAEAWQKKLHQSIGKIENLSKGAQADYYYNSGVLAQRSFQPKHSRIFLNKAIAEYNCIYPSSTHVKKILSYTQLGLSYFAFEKDVRPFYQNVEKAYSVIQKNPKLLPYCLETELAMISVCLWKRKYESAEIHCNNVIHLAKNQPNINVIALANAICVKGRLRRYFADGDSAKMKIAIQTINKSIQLVQNIEHPILMELYRHLAVCYLSLSDFTHFFETLHKLEIQEKKWKKNDRYSSHLLGKYHLARKNYQQAIYHFRSYLCRHEEKDSTISEQMLDDSHHLLADGYAESDRFDSAYFYIARNILHDTPLQNTAVDVVHMLKPEIYKLSPFPFWSLQKLGKVLKLQYQNEKPQNPELLYMALRAYTICDSLLFVDYPLYDDDMLLNIYKEIGPSVCFGALEALHELSLIFPQKANYYKGLTAHFIDRSKSDVLYRNLPNHLPSDALRTLKMNIEEITLKKNRSYSENQKLAFDRFSLSNIKQRTDNLKYQFLNAAQVQKSLNAKESVLQYRIGKDYSYLLYIDQDSLILHRIAIGADRLIHEVDKLYHSIEYESSVNNQEYINAAHQMYKWLVDPVFQRLTKHPRVCIIADGCLNRIPFEALLTKPDTKLTQNSPFLISANPDLVFAYSAAWKMNENHRKNAATELSAPAAFFNYGRGRGKLLYSHREETAIAKAFPLSFRAFKGWNCTKNKFLHSWSQKQYQIYAFSLHANANDQDPLDTKIWFGTEQKDPMYGFEIGQTKGDAALVVLSACQSGSGNIVLGEGVYSLSRSFFQGGAQAVVAALWEVNNSPNANLLAYFYDNAKHGDAVQALSDAKRQYLRQNSYSHPRYWAGNLYLD